MLGAAGAGHAEARETSAGFAVHVRLTSSARAADVTKTAAAAATARDPASSLHELKVSVPTRSGYFVRFEIVDPAVQLVEIHERGRVIRLTSAAGRVFIRPGQEEPLTYRVMLRPGARLAEPAAVRVTLQP